jgi:hypothetical protein
MRGRTRRFGSLEKSELKLSENPDEYDDEEALAEYAWYFCRKRMTETELKLFKAVYW